MLCKSCGKELKADAKFCGSCGTKIDAVTTLQVKLASLPGGLADCPIVIKEISAQGPDSCGDLTNLEIKYEVQNNSKIDWDHLAVRGQILDAAGNIIEERASTYEQTISAGESEEIVFNFYSIKAAVFGLNPEKAQAILTGVASISTQVKLGEISLPETPYQIAQLPLIKIDNALQIVSGSLCKFEPDDEKEVRVEAKILIQNITSMQLPEVKLIAQVIDKTGREISDIASYEEVRPRSICMMSGAGYAKDKKLKGAKVEIKIQSLVPVAAGLSQYSGVNISEIAVEVEENEDTELLSDNWPFSSNAASSGRTTKVQYEINGLILKFASKEDLTSFLEKPEMRFEFDPSNSDNGGEDILDPSGWPLTLDLSESNSIVSARMHREDEFLAEVDVEVRFELELAEAADQDQFDEWAANEGGYSSCYVTASGLDADTETDEGQKLFTIKSNDVTSLSQLVDVLVSEFKVDPRTKVFVPEVILLASIAEETGNPVTPLELRTVITAYKDGELSEDHESVYDAAVYVCGLVARNCFGDTPEDDIDYEIDWIENDDGSYSAQVRSS